MRKTLVCHKNRARITLSRPYDLNRGTLSRRRPGQPQSRGALHGRVRPACRADLRIPRDARALAFARARRLRLPAHARHELHRALQSRRRHRRGRPHLPRTAGLRPHGPMLYQKRYSIGICDGIMRYITKLPTGSAAPTLDRFLFYSASHAHTPLRNTGTSVPSSLTPVMSRSSVPIIKSTCTADALTPRPHSSASGRSSPPS